MMGKNLEFSHRRSATTRTGDPPQEETRLTIGRGSMGFVGERRLSSSSCRITRPSPSRHEDVAKSGPRHSLLQDRSIGFRSSCSRKNFESGAYDTLQPTRKRMLSQPNISFARLRHRVVRTKIVLKLCPQPSV